MAANLIPLRGRASGAVVLMGPCMLTVPRNHGNGLRAVDAIFHLPPENSGGEKAKLYVGLWIDQRVSGEIIGGRIYWVTANVSR
jgi:hypothetical protein